ncbi:frataxin family protein [Zavarzinia compransoris]|uniref:Iron donor protein CyaY n=1 Tax=Zavarzinia compransoris TaxID=1264899 RepID=A0A317E6C2_9PROT|nr:frataxin family protein [Zavarzinia compransoris]PWR21780.1 iron donor protein CyaY [Zavarzinia compransoris]TDP45421.1 iron donor protein CyaY [Zavarzinia compransoris]
MALDDKDYRRQLEACLGHWLDVLEATGAFDELDLADGVLQAETEDGKVFILNRHLPLKQVWLSSPVSGAHHYAFDEGRGGWFSTRGGEALADRLRADLGQIGIGIAG